MFGDANRPGVASYRDGWQKHHLIPLAANHDPNTAAMLRSLRDYGFLLNDFRANGVLLPSTREVARRSGLPMHRGGHLRYNRFVLDYLDATRVISERFRSERLSVIYARTSITQCQQSLRNMLAKQRAETVNDIVFPPDFMPIDARIVKP